MRKKAGPRESAIVDKIRKALHAAGWTLVEKTHGDEVMMGWPDLMAYMPTSYAYGRVAWIEVKRRKPRGTFTPAQRDRFPKWEAAGLGVWVLDSPDLSPLDRPPNWRDWDSPGKPLRSPRRDPKPPGGGKPPSTPARRSPGSGRSGGTMRALFRELNRGT